ncbi:MAG: recombinase family protein [Oscillospiraceae bacterium]|nr:recombinase family protein [Oscillospiraceae bacterium]
MQDVKNIAIYKRVSDQRQARDGYSLAAQERLLRGWCEANGHTVIAVYTDEGISGKDTKHRHGFSEMMAAAQRREFDAVLVLSLTRFTRSVADLYQSLEQLQRVGVAFISHTEHFDTSTAMGRAMMGMLGVFAQLEREVIAERTRIAYEERAQQGRPTAAYVLGYDKVDKQLVINHAEAATVRYIFDTYQRLGKIRAVNELCAAHGYRGKLGGPLAPGSVRKILVNPIYAGYNSWHGEPIKGTHAPIIKPKQFNRVQRMLLRNGRPHRRKRGVVRVP